MDVTKPWPFKLTLHIQQQQQQQQQQFRSKQVSDLKYTYIHQFLNVADPGSCGHLEKVLNKSQRLNNKATKFGKEFPPRPLD
jgi:hypothetical protein